MCGIAVLVGVDTRPPPGAIERMVESLAHRGPDDQGVVQRRTCHLGHTRLEVIDPTGGTQPMGDGDEQFFLVFNGEIYNFQELRRQLQDEGVAFRTRSDTEVLLRAYRRYGDAVVDRLNGQFAFAIWDDRHRRLFAARDRLGEKPLYWAQSPQGHLLIGSEIRAVLAADLIRPTLDATSVDAFLKLIYVPPDRTIYQNVHALRPGHALVWQAGRVRQWSYWTPRLSVEPIDAVEAVRRTRTLIERAVERQTVADTTVGAFLSGGLDSATIVALMSRLPAAAPIKTFAVGFGDLIDELPYARAVAAQYGTDHAEIQMEIPVARLLERMADVYDEPFGDSSNIPTYLISEFARRHVKVVLSGDGGDELFGGYAWYEPLLLHDRLPDSLAQWVLYRALAKTSGVLSRLGLPLGSRRDRAKTWYKGIGAKRRTPDLWQRHLAALSAQGPDGRRPLWGRRLDQPAEEALARAYQPDKSVRGIDRAVDFDLRCYLPGDIFVKVDRASMAHGLETRSPLVDVELVEFVLGLPARLRFGGSSLKHLLRGACADLWPEAVKRRSKQGFGAPIAAWLQRPDVQQLAARVLDSRGPLADLLPGVLPARQRLERQPQTAWNLLCLGLWLERRSSWTSSLRLAS